MRKINLGCGTNRLKGWANFDAEVDITKPLPFPDSDARFILCEHCVEHVPYYDAIKFFKECWRVLMPLGVLRIAVPSIEQIWKYGTDDYFRFTQRFGNVKGDMRGAMHAILYAHGHQTAWTESLLQATLIYCGYHGINRRDPGFSTHDELRGVEGHGKVIGDVFNRIETVVCEATKGVS